MKTITKKAIDNANYETYITFTGDDKEIEKFKSTVLVKGFFDFLKVLPIPKDIAEHPMIESGCFSALMLGALEHDPKIDYVGNIEQKYSKDKFYKNYLLPFTETGIKYESFSKEELIKHVLGGTKPMGKETEYTIEDAIMKLSEQASKHTGEADEALERMRKYGCATRYSWRLKYWGTPMEATGCQVRPSKAKTAPYTDDAILVYTTGGNGEDIFEFMAKKYFKLNFEIIWRRIENDKAPEDTSIKGKRLVWVGGKLKESEDFYYKKTAIGKTEEELDTLMTEKKKTFREGWDKE